MYRTVHCRCYAGRYQTEFFSRRRASGNTREKPFCGHIINCVQYRMICTAGHIVPVPDEPPIYISARQAPYKNDTTVTRISTRQIIKRFIKYQNCPKRQIIRGYIPIISIISLFPSININRLLIFLQITSLRSSGHYRATTVLTAQCTPRVLYTVVGISDKASLSKPQQSESIDRE